MKTKKLLTLSETQGMLLSVMIDFDNFCRNKQLEYYMIGGTILGAIRHNGFIPWDDDIDVGMIRHEYEKFVSLINQFNPKYEIKNYRIADNCDYAITRIYIPDTYIDNPSYRKSKLDQRLYFDIFPLDYAPNEQSEQDKQRERLIRLKTLLSLTDFKIYNHRIDKVLGRKILSLLLHPLRSLLLKKTDNIMAQYKDTEYICSMASQYDYHKQLFRKNVYGKPIEYTFEGHFFYGPAMPDEYLKQLYGKNYMELPPESKRRKGFDIYLEEK